MVIAGVGSCGALWQYCHCHSGPSALSTLWQYCHNAPMDPTPAITLARRSLGRDGELEPIRVANAKCARAPRHVGRLGIERAAKILDSLRDLVDALRGYELERESLAFRPVHAFGAVVLIEQDPYSS